MIPRERRVSFRAGSTLPAPESRALERPAPAVLRSSRFKSKTRPISVRSLKKKTITLIRAFPSKKEKERKRKAGHSTATNTGTQHQTSGRTLQPLHQPLDLDSKQRRNRRMTGSTPLGPLQAAPPTNKVSSGYTFFFFWIK